MKILTDEIANEVIGHIEVCKSDSGVMGERLRSAHYELGKTMGRYMACELKATHPRDFTVVCLMRSGLFFGMGISDELDCTLLLLDDKNDPQWSNPDPIYTNRFIAENLLHIQNKTIILADAVLNTGKSMFSVFNQIAPFARDVVISVNVVQERATEALKCKRMYAIRSSKNQFVGANVTHQKDGKGPDTGDRLFKTIHEYESANRVSHFV